LHSNSKGDGKRNDDDDDDGDCDGDDDVEQYLDIIDRNDQRIREWNKATKNLEENMELKPDDMLTGTTPMNANEDHKGHHDAETPMYNALYNAYRRSQGLREEQSKRMQQVITNGYLPELMAIQPLISKQIAAKEKSIESALDDQKAMEMRYTESQSKRQRLVAVIEDTIAECNATIKEENQLLLELTEQRQSIESMKSQQQTLLAATGRLVSIIDAYNVFETTSEEYLDRMGTYFNGKWNEFESEWWEWSGIDLLSWLRHKTEGKHKGNVNWKLVRREIVKRNINGTSLQNFSESSLDLIGIYDFNITSYLMEQISSLRDRFKPTLSGDQSDEEEVPAHFICPLTKEIMSDPVMAFDRNTYEREAIEKYLEEQGSSPVTGEKAYTFNVYSHRQLKQEIQGYCASKKSGSPIEGVYASGSSNDGSNDTVDID